MKQALLKKGIVFPVAVPEPAIKAGFVKIRVRHSCVSAGTEMGGIGESRKGLLRRALENPQKIAAAIAHLKDRGVRKTRDKLGGIADALVELGYSLAGEVVEVGAGVELLSAGDRVAAGGMRLAVHAEYVTVPKNLVAKIPREVETWQASTATVGSIALHGVRRADLRIGEYGVVLGGGLIGLLALEIWRGAGVRVACVDINPKRLRLARELGAEIAVDSGEEDPVNAVRFWSGGHGADAVLFTAATPDSEPLSQAFRMSRKKGRVVLVGVSGMTVKRKDIYGNEIDFLISTSYGPGRYDDQYEMKGIDYPYPYVRWTENRNMAEFLRLLKAGAIDLGKLGPKIVPIDRVGQAFQDLEKDPTRNILTIIEYPLETERAKEIRLQPTEPMADGKEKAAIEIGLIGAGGFAAGMLLPIIARMPDHFRLRTVVNRGGKKALDVARRFHAARASSDIGDVLEDPDIDLVLVATRHNDHAALALRALHAGKHVFVEKPMAVTREQLQGIRAFYEADPTVKKPLLMVGFNRRFSPYVREVKRHTEMRTNPLFMRYRMNAGYAPADSWVHEDGGRIVGEACHLIDLMLYLAGSMVHEVQVSGLTPNTSAFRRSDNKSFTLSFEDGSLAVIDYFAVGGKELPKELLEVHFDGKSIVVDDYKKIIGYGLQVAALRSKLSQKGHDEEWQALADSLRHGGAWPIPLRDLLETTELSLLVADS